jgi:hypothetical protein
MAILKRGGAYQLRRRVPERYRSVEPRTQIWMSLHTDSETIARPKAGQAWTESTEVWEARLAGAVPGATMSSSNACGDPSNTKKSICTPMTACQTHAAASANT